jgi:hypothetical protein
MSALPIGPLAPDEVAELPLVTRRPDIESPPQRRPQLRVVPPPRVRAPRAPFVLLVVGLLIAGLVAMLMLNTALAQGAFQINDLRQQGTGLSDEQDALQRKLADERRPGVLADRARALGLVPAGAPTFLRLPDGAVLGAKPSAGDGSGHVAPADSAANRDTANSATNRDGASASKPSSGSRAARETR